MSSSLNTQETQPLFKLFFARGVASIALLFVFSWFERYTDQLESSFIIVLVSTWMLLSIGQLILLRRKLFLAKHTLIQLCSDLLLLGLTIHSSGGITSPFIFLLGLVIIVAGAQFRVLFTLFITVLATTTYLTAVYIPHDIIPAEASLGILLQTSLFFLTGGIMAIIASRHAQLNDKQKKTSTERKQLQEIHGQVLNVMHEGVITLRENFTILAFNPSAAQTLGMSGQHTGFNINTFISIPDAITNSSFNGKSNVFRHEIERNNLTLLLTFTKLYNDIKASWLLTIVDITETRKLEKKLAEQDKLASIGRMSAMLAHEIRNPMQTISQAAELMGLKHKDLKMEHIITDEIARLNRLVSDMLDFASPLHPKPAKVSIIPIIQSSIEQIDLHNTQKIQTDVPDIEVLLDADHLRLILDNLLRNAHRVSSMPSSISITFHSGHEFWRLSVLDQGPGIKEKLKKTLFKPFQTGHATGYGLGLATVWQVCQANNWKVWVDESYSDGACFIVQGNISPIYQQHGEQRG